MSDRRADIDISNVIEGTRRNPQLNSPPGDAPADEEHAENQLTEMGDPLIAEQHDSDTSINLDTVRQVLSTDDGTNDPIHSFK